ncbi:unnamed protein product [Hymenolepis diminuta]|uniref:PPM-type phosphatase domain-containing protein n=1 Tax=Hymenolepis diminuta TaxID=6216 RepID=A0A564Y491_HYMDI|nr:unnamed protein product [Hymenolepis diminuta]
MGTLLSTPVTDKINETGEGNNLRYGLASMQGWRSSMEDAHCAITRLPGHLREWSFFAVFDGHAGALVSEQCASELLNRIVDTEEFKNIDPELAPSIEEIRQGIREGFLSLDEEMRKLPQIVRGLDRSGSTAVCVLVTPKHLFFVNCGDSRAVLIRDGAVGFATTDHKPAHPSERKRIQNAGGSVIVDRVNGNLAVSRSLGDYSYKTVRNLGPTEQLVSPEPEITVIDRDLEKDQMVVLACDGVWDVMSNEHLCCVVSERMTCMDDLSRICNEVIDYCLYSGSSDNMSMVLVAFEPAPKVIPENQAKDKTLEQKVESIANEIVSNDSKGSMNELLSSIRSRLNGDFAPHAVFCKGALVQRILDAHAPPSPTNGAGNNSPDTSSRPPQSKWTLSPPKRLRRVPPQHECENLTNGNESSLNGRVSMIQQLLVSCQGIMTNGVARPISSLSLRTVKGSDDTSDSETVVEVGQEPIEDGLPESSSTIVGDDDTKSTPLAASQVVNGAKLD